MGDRRERRARPQRAPGDGADADAGPGAAHSAAPAPAIGPGALYLVATPIGNLEDISVRAIRVLREARLIAAEDTRHTAKLLARYQVTTPTLSYHEHNQRARLGAIFATLAEGDVALVSDAGTPGLSDPGYELVRAAIDRGIPVIPVPGASALLAAVVASGLVPGPFSYYGFPPRQATARRELFARAAASPLPAVFYEAPHRLVATLRALHESYGERQVTVARELTKVHEEVRRESLAQAVAHFTEVPPRGEFTIVVAGAEERPPSVSDEGAEAAIRERLLAGLSPTAAAKEAARATGRSRAELYALAVTLRQRAGRPPK